MHAHAHKTSNQRLLISMLLLGLFAAVEAIAGWLSGSIALISDAGHMATDVIALGLASYAVWIAKKPPTSQHSFGMGRAEVLGALLNALLNILIIIPIVVEAIKRFESPTPVNGLVVSGVSLLMLLVTFVAYITLGRGGEQTLNIRAAILHLLGDILGSVGAFIAGAVIYFTGWTPIDPILSIAICCLILYSTINLLKETLVILMEGVPRHLKLDQVSQQILAIEHVKSIGDLHIWTLSSGKIMFTAHIQIEELSHWPAVEGKIRLLLKQSYEITHVTLQPTSVLLEEGCYLDFR